MGRRIEQPGEPLDLAALLGERTGISALLFIELEADADGTAILGRLVDGMLAQRGALVRHAAERWILP